MHYANMNNMQYCNFSLQEQPEEFKAFLRTDADDALDVVSPSSLTLNALVQDLLRGMSVLHSRRIVHCDLKPRQRARAVEPRRAKQQRD